MVGLGFESRTEEEKRGNKKQLSEAVPDNTGLWMCILRVIASGMEEEREIERLSIKVVDE